MPKKKPRGVLVAAYVPPDLRARALKAGANRIWSLSQVLRVALFEFCSREEKKRKAA